jgi:hypothetical protein
VKSGTFVLAPNQEIELSMAPPGEAPQALVAIKDWDHGLAGELLP